MQALRALSASAALDALLARAEWRDRLDAARIGAFGVSQGGETLMLLGGAELTYDAFNLDRHKQVTQRHARAGRRRLRAVLRRADRAGVRQRAGGCQRRAAAVPRAVRHERSDRTGRRRARRARSHGRAARPRAAERPGPRPRSRAAARTSSRGRSMFLVGVGRRRRRAKARLRRVEHVEGGLDDHKVLYVDPTGGTGAGRGRRHDRVPQRRARPLLHHRVPRGGRRARRRRAAGLDAHGQVVPRRGSPAPGRATRRAASSARPAVGPNSHFYTIDAAECDKVKANPGLDVRGARLPRGRAAVDRLRTPSTRRSRACTTTAWAARRITAT